MFDLKEIVQVEVDGEKNLESGIKKINSRGKVLNTVLNPDTQWRSVTVTVYCTKLVTFLYLIYDLTQS